MKPNHSLPIGVLLALIWLSPAHALNLFDGFGYVVKDSTQPGGPSYFWDDISATGFAHDLADDGSVTGIPIGFSFRFYGVEYTTLNICNNGFIWFGATTGCPYVNQGTPTQRDPDNIIAIYWDDLYTDGLIYNQTKGTAPNRYTIIQWQNYDFYACSANAGDMAFQIVLYENTSDIQFNYRDVDNACAGSDYGASATIGIENATGELGLQYRMNYRSLSAGFAIRFYYPRLPNITSAEFNRTLIRPGDQVELRVHLEGGIGGISQVIARFEYPNGTQVNVTLLRRILVSLEEFSAVFPPAGWSTGGHASWFATTAVVYSGTYSAASGDVADNQHTWLNWSHLRLNDSIIRFYWNVSSESGYDFLYFALGPTIAGYTYGISGAGAWSFASHRIAGNVSPFWIYAKDGSITAGLDMGWVDRVELIQNTSEFNALWSDTAQGGIYYVRNIWIQDGTGNWVNISFGDSLNFTVDDVPPWWSDLGSNLTKVYKNQSILLHAFWMDNIELDSAILSWNATPDRAWINASSLSLAGNASWSNFSLGFDPRVIPGIKSWRIHANDSAGNWNSTLNQLRIMGLG